MTGLVVSAVVLAAWGVLVWARAAGHVVTRAQLDRLAEGDR